MSDSTPHTEPTPTEKQLLLITRGTNACVLLTFFLSAPLWFTVRPYPLVPLFDVSVPTFLASALAVAFVCSATAGLLRPAAHWPAWATLGFWIALVALDRSRLLVPMYFCMVLVFLQLTCRGKKPRLYFPALLALVAAVYVWSGLHKIHILFPYTIFATLTKPVTALLPVSMLPLMTTLGWATPFIEAGAGLALLRPRTRKAGAWCLIGMHLGLLALLGPFGIGHNSVVWPWNLLMILLLWVISTRTEEELNFSAIVASIRGNLVLGLVTVVIPLAALGGLVDSYLGFSLYSPDKPRMIFWLPIENKRFPELLGIKNYVTHPLGCKEDEATKCISVQFSHYMWTLATMNTVPYYASPVQRAEIEGFCKLSPDLATTVIDQYSPPNRFTGKKILTRTSCKEVMGVP